MFRISKMFLIAVLLMFGNSLFAQEDANTSNTMYLEMNPSFVLNYGGGGKLKYLRTDITLPLSTEGTLIDDINLHMPILRHAVIMFLSKQNEERIRDGSQRETIRLELLQELRAALADITNTDGIKDLLFTTFFIQQ
jgi:flagellar FliL protein